MDVGTLSFSRPLRAACNIGTQDMLQEAQTTRGQSQNNLRVLYALQRANGPLTAYQILDRLKKHGVSGPTTVYRALHRLILDGTGHRIETLNAYVVCTHPEHRAAPTFVICEQCNLVTEINDNKIDAHLRQRTCKVGVVFKTASIEIRGTCATCLPKLPVKTRP